MVNPEASSTGQRHSPFTLVQDTGGNWRPPGSIDSTGGGDGGNPLEPRLAKLESDVGNIIDNMSDLKSDIREIRSALKSDFKWVMAAIVMGVVVILGGIGWMYNAFTDVVMPLVK